MKKISSLAGPLSLAMAIALGVYAAWIVVAACLQMVFPSWRYDQVMMLENGTMIIATFSSRNPAEVEYRNLDGSPHVPLGPGGPYTPGTLLPANRSGIVSVGWSSRLGAYVSPRPTPTYWYYVADRAPPARLYFVGFEPISKARVGHVGRNGFSKVKPAPAEQFVDAQVANTMGWYDAHEPEVAASRTPSGAAWPAYVTSGDTIYRVDFKDFTVTPILRQRGIVSVVQLSHLPKDDASRTTLPLVVRTGTQILLLGDDNTPEHVYEIPAELRQDHLYIYVLPDKTILAQTFSLDVGQRRQFVTFNARGEVLGRIQSSAYSTEPMWQVSAVAATPTFDTLLSAVIIPISQTAMRPTKGYGAAFHDTLSQTWPGLVVNYVLGIGTACICLLWQRRYGLPNTSVWTAFAFLLGIPGLLGYRFHRSPPPMADCPACGNSVPRDRAACRDCGQPFPRSARRGTEIFA